MPKETIAMNAPQDSDAPQHWRLSVGWDRDAADVQVAAVIDEDPFGSGQVFRLERPQINHLIRALRKARDAAFGSDA